MMTANEPTPPLADLPLTPERWEVIRPKLESLLAELAKLETLEAWELEPDTTDAWGAASKVRQGEVAGER